MSGLQEDLLGPKITKKKVIALVLVSAILIGIFAYSVVFFSWLLGSSRLNPNDELADAEEENPLLTQPPSPYNVSDLLELFQDMDIDLTPEQLEDLMGMMDGSIDDLDLSDFADMQTALLFSNITVFYIYNYDSISSLSDNLWKYESYDEFLGSTWQSTSPLNDYSFYPLSEYTSQHSALDLLEISIPLSPDAGFNSLVIPTLFPIPFVIENSVNSNNINPSGTDIHKNDFNSTSLILDFTSSGDVNVSYEMFGLDLPTFSEIDAISDDEDSTPTNIQNQYLQLPPDITTYINANPFFENHYNALDLIIQDSDKATQVVSKIKSYLETNFNLGYDQRESDPPTDDEDIVEWFCEHQEGVWSDFASAFCAFTRAFGVASRYINGYNSRFIEEEFDPLRGQSAVPIKYRNIYNWAEVYIPTLPSGDGQWVQVDVCENLIAPLPGGSGDFNITLSCNFTEGYRNQGNIANLTAHLTSVNSSISNRPIRFYDVSMDSIIDTVSTNQDGYAWTLVDIDILKTIGPHIISADFNLNVNDTTNYVVLGGNVSIYLTNINPSSLDITLNQDVSVQGYLEDPLNGNRIRFADILINLFPEGSNIPIPNAFNPPGTNTGYDGNLDDSFTLLSSLSGGTYDVRADFNGSWAFGSYFYPKINGSSNRLQINITRPEICYLDFYINNVPDYITNLPVLKRSSIVQLKAILRNDTGDRKPGELVRFYDSTNTLIGENYTNSNGIALFHYSISPSIAAGPNKVLARFSTTYNSSYYIVNAPINLVLNPFPQPRVISRVASDNEAFVIQGHLFDSDSNRIPYGMFNVRMFDGVSDVSYYLTQDSGSLIANSNGDIYVEYGVQDYTPVGNYTIEVSFNGIFNYPFPEPYFDLSGIANFSSLINSTYDLEVEDPSDINILFEIDGNPTQSFYNDFNLPNRYIEGDFITFEVNIYQSGIPVNNDTVRFYDVDNGNALIHQYSYNGSESPGGYYSYLQDTSSWKAGLHQIRVTWGNYGTYNTTYIIINESASISLDQSNLQVQRGIEGFTISGDIKDGGEGLRGLIVGIYLFDTNFNDFSDNLNYNLGSQQNITINSDGTFQWNIASIDSSLLQGSYYLRVDFNGSISELGIFLTDYMVHFSSSLINLNVTARTSLEGYYTRNFLPGWYTNDTCTVTGTLRWDNTSIISGAIVNISVYNGLGTLLDSKVDITDSFGQFNVSFTVQDDWDDNTEIWVYYYPEDNPSLPFTVYSEQELFLS